MKKKTLGLLLTVIISSPLCAIANSDNSQYPAANFQPTVIFADESAQSATSSAFDPEFPAASFQPKILFSNVSLNKPKGETSAFDPAFPAANFEPKVIYP